MSKKNEVNYIGDTKYLKQKEVEKTAIEVIKNYWRFSCAPPDVFKLDINVVTDSEIKEINQKYLDRDCPTDVIAFSFSEGEKMPEKEIPVIGQIIISKDAAKRQAVEYKHSIEKEMTILLVHGLLHVAGWEEGEEIQAVGAGLVKKVNRTLAFGSQKEMKIIET